MKENVGEIETTKTYIYLDMKQHIYKHNNK